MRGSGGFPTSLESSADVTTVYSYVTNNTSVSRTVDFFFVHIIIVGVVVAVEERLNNHSLLSGK